ncbi:uncharacterized protein [Argopecten irradians]|uniref:uncharacterized protein n=1 Tax=Argopecten irradians TaxID=31199 RepID=UPI0037107DB8
MDKKTDFIELKNEISKFSLDGKILLAGDFNARTGNLTDFQKHDDVSPHDVKINKPNKRESLDQVINVQGRQLIDLCISSRLRILNGRYLGDLLGNCSCIKHNGSSVVDYVLTRI